MIYVYAYKSPLGEIFISSDGKVLTRVSFNEHTSKSSIITDNLPIFQLTKTWLDTYFSGKKPSFIPPYTLANCSEFQKKILKILSNVPYSHLTTYGEIAQQFCQQENLPRMSAQAVGGAISKNPICLILPCHRVIGKNHQLTGYHYGIDKKASLLQLEGHNIKFEDNVYRLG